MLKSALLVSVLLSSVPAIADIGNCIPLPSDSGGKTVSQLVKAIESKTMAVPYVRAPNSQEIEGCPDMVMILIKGERPGNKIFQIRELVGGTDNICEYKSVLDGSSSICLNLNP